MDAEAEKFQSTTVLIALVDCGWISWRMSGITLHRESKNNKTRVDNFAKY